MSGSIANKALVWLVLCLVVATTISTVAGFRTYPADDVYSDSDEELSEYTGLGVTTRRPRVCSMPASKQCCKKPKPVNRMNLQTMFNLAVCLTEYIKNMHENKNQLPDVCCKVKGLKQLCNRNGPITTLDVLNRDYYEQTDMITYEDGRQTRQAHCPISIVSKCCPANRMIMALGPENRIIGELIACITDIIQNILTFKIPDSCCAIPFISLLCFNRPTQSPPLPPPPPLPPSPSLPPLPPPPPPPGR